MKRTFVEILVILGVFAIAWFARGEFAPKVVDNTVTDTVRVDVPYEVEVIKEVEKPITVTKYETKYDTVTNVVVKHDTVEISTLDNTYTYNSRFLTAYPTSPRFLGAEQRGGKLSLTYQRVSGDTDSKTWKVADRGWVIGLNNGQPNIRTFRDEKPSFNASVEAGWLQSLNYSSPYLELSGEFRILGIDITGTGNLNTKPFGMVGIKHEFNN